VVYTENFKITRGKGNCFEFMYNSNSIKELKSSEIRKRCAIHIFDILMVNLFALLILISVTLIVVQPLKVYGMLLANLTILTYFIYFEDSSRTTRSGKKWINRIYSSFESKKISVERAFFSYFTGGVAGFLLATIDVAANGVAMASEHLGFYFIIPFVTYAPVLFMNFRQNIHDLFTGMVFLKNPAVNSAVNLGGNEE
jgi:hypothetical protein